jgi:hypothetical protein
MLSGLSHELEVSVQSGVLHMGLLKVRTISIFILVVVPLIPLLSFPYH